MSDAAAAEATSSGALEVVRGPGFGLLTNSGGLGETACGPYSLAKRVLLDRVLEAEATLGVDAEIVLLLTTEAPSCSSIYYLSVANDIGGIGYAHTDGREFFDDSPDSELEGIAFLNDWPYWSARPEEFQSAFNHEVAHRWGARVHAHVEGQELAVLLGREHSHWSYFLSSQGSPHEGNVWLPTAEGFRADTPRYPWRFSDLDLYLMGVAPPSEVAPLSLLEPSSLPELDCEGRPLSSWSPPHCPGTVIQAQPRTVAIDDIIAVEGPRIPEAVSSSSVDVLVLVLASREAPLAAEDCGALAASVRARFEGFAAAAGGRMALNNVLAFETDCAASCAALAEAEPSLPRAITEPRTPPSACALDARRGDSAASWIIGAMLAALARRRRHRGRLAHHLGVPPAGRVW